MRSSDFNPSYKSTASLPLQSSLVTIDEQKLYDIDNPSYWFNDLQQYRNIFEEIEHTALDQLFQEQLNHISHWYDYLKESQRTATIYTLLQQANPVQLKFFYDLIQNLLKESGPSNPLMINKINQQANLSFSSITAYTSKKDSTHSFSSNNIDKLSRIFDDSSSWYNNDEQPTFSKNSWLNLLQRQDSSVFDKTVDTSSKRRSSSIDALSNTSWTSFPAAATDNNQSSSLLLLPVSDQSKKQDWKRPLSICSVLSTRKNDNHHHQVSQPRKTQSSTTDYKYYSSIQYPPESIVISDNSSNITFDNRIHSTTTDTHMKRDTIDNKDAVNNYFKQHKRKEETTDINNFKNKRHYSYSFNNKYKYVNMGLLEDTTMWMKSLRLHKYNDIFGKMKWQDIVKLDEEGLKAKGVNALGARRKLLKVFEGVKEHCQTNSIEY
ncbi:uncharacterized protein BX663DRAFT_557404 [Cokeromyces recurvatus]|uniref:uncharacterized protein n=1 Tax=Cokeromyces recurvatus TaxID=90255 RepID=UPI00221F6442|nr:uncharacterized protein BX663DRAFT_557404 [Cokeromyces recurvatus]KAI7908254.1 hypothetical protein BX663DRAFT_557404 [Cokeromyces recurvatus]